MTQGSPLPRVEMDYERGVIRVQIGNGGERWRVLLGEGKLYVTLDQRRQPIALEVVLRWPWRA